MLGNTVFGYERLSDSALAFCIDRWAFPALGTYFTEQQSLEWVKQLVAADLAEVHREVFDWFAKKSDTLTSLQWREFEELIGAAFTSQGMTVHLGPGQADGGVDLHLVRHAVAGDVITAVQAKSGRTPVRLHYVQALAAASLAGGADEALFVTTSRYFPGARKWAEQWQRTTGHRLQLASSSDVASWCAAARDRIWVSCTEIRDPTPRGSGPLVGSILVSRHKGILALNQFAIVIRETSGAALLRMLDKETIRGHPLESGDELPVLAMKDNMPQSLRAARWIDWSLGMPSLPSSRALVDEGGFCFEPWDGAPQPFNHIM